VKVDVSHMCSGLPDRGHDEVEASLVRSAEATCRIAIVCIAWSVILAGSASLPLGRGVAADCCGE
jgi:hypothetical protein